MITKTEEKSTTSEAFKREKQIEWLKESFSKKLSEAMNLTKISAPLIVQSGTGINDDLNGIEKAVQVRVKGLGSGNAEVVHSLAKWKRMKLANYQIPENEGIYTNMKALRQDEDLSELHSVYVDQWDWEKCISSEQRSIESLKENVRKIYRAILETEKELSIKHPEIEAILPEKIHFIHAEDILALYPELSAKEREHAIAKELKAVFIIGIGADLSNGTPHDRRAPDYDDWSSPDPKTGKQGLNGDILFWNPSLGKSMEISSMGIRVDKDAMEKQLKITRKLYRKNLLFHRMVLEESVPLSIGGGIGQSRLCMFLLKRKHIGEVQSSVWPDSIENSCRNSGTALLF